MSIRTLLMGEPGCGKTWMVCKTAPKRPVHVWDIDQKIGAMGWARALRDSGELTYWELAESYTDESIKDRLRELAAKQSDESARKLRKQPQGLIRFSDMIYDIEKDADAMKAGSWFLDSATFLGEHAKTNLMYLAARNKYTFDQWNGYLIFWRDTMSVLSDVAKHHEKDLFVSVHEKTSERPGDRITGVKYEMIKSGDEMIRQRQFIGTMDPAVLPSIDGQFASHMGAFFEEVYHLYTVVEDDRVSYKCRVKPDGKRALRTSFDVGDKVVFDADARKIWR